MKFGVLCYENSFNLGDEIQSIAAERFLPRVDYLIDRDSGKITSLNAENKPDDKIKVIYNGWFDGNYCKFPPSPRIIPLFISFHINEIDHSKDPNYSILKKETFNPITSFAPYLGMFEPIRCRDLNTTRMLLKKDILAYFSGCLTLTLKNDYMGKRSGITIVDTDVLFKDLYHELIPEDIRSSARYIYQGLDSILPHEEKRKLAKEHLKILQSSELVITSRLHTLLPCVAYQIPVIFIHGDSEDVRFSGLKSFFKIYGHFSQIDFGDHSKHLIRNTELSKMIHNLETIVKEFITG